MENPGIQDGLGQCFHKLKDYEKAIGSFKESIEKEPHNVDFLTNRALCYYDMGEYDLAIEDLQLALKQNESDPMVLYRLGSVYFANKKYKKCVSTLKLALANKPYQIYEADIYYHVGLGYARVEKFEKSIFPFSRCVDRIPDDIRYIHERAKSFQMINMHEKAVDDFTMVIKRNPKNAHAHFRRAFSLKALKVSIGQWWFILFLAIC